ncbi:amidohydrolase [Streptomyces lunaelactis]|uniref:amidohydrolase n=1 Tax=Streptomyces lunaelactis TaxID=1535768 RepID=UPI0015845DDA|nr:amidohydrolase [Streptomyces lunaelactis]NUK38058.1 amidohydrolase [Streptomyces lunaelactis]NUK41372.1 amidohydrolase [Streptomyces lunaelactis]NUK96429.1 amidohydrolase [Streptomyces lunaelactis]NUL14273.1 amidohydrolase [Streptomyces lunaelactis]NUL34158.1 amidohydrolase [Streptomyces lunaelactis]
MSPDLSRRRLLAAATAAGAAAALAPAASATASTRTATTWRSAALVVHNARVLTGERHAPVHGAIAVGRDGRVLAVGPSAVVRRLAGRDTDVVDARRATVMSGIVDAHAHPLEAGARTLNPSLANESFTVGQLQEKLRWFLTDSAGKEPDGWLVVEDWNPVGLPAGTETHHRILDALPTRRPIALLGSDAHNTWVNQRALDLAAITAATPDPAGGEIVHGADGSPTGLLKDTASDLVTRLIPEPDEAALLDVCAKALARAAAMGVTTFMDAAVSGDRLETYAGLARTGRLLQRIVPALRLSAEQTKDPAAALAYVRGLRKQYGEVAGLHFGTVKVFLDGVIEYPAQTAALLTPYLDGDGKPTDNRGDLYVTAAEYGRLATVLDRAGWQLHGHAIGDRAVRTALDGYEAALRANGRRGNRHTIAHLQLIHPDDFRRFGRLGVVACMQLQWAMRDVWTMDALLPYIGADRHRLLYPARSLQRYGAVLSGGSDWPVDPLGPWNQIRTAIDRESEVAEQGALYPELEGIDRSAALRMHTAGSAYQLRLEGRTGTLTPGKAADLVVLDRDVTRVPVKELSDTRVRLTLVGGEVVHELDSAVAKTLPTPTATPTRPASLAQMHGGRHDACGCTPVT